MFAIIMVDCKVVVPLKKQVKTGVCSLSEHCQSVISENYHEFLNYTPLTTSQNLSAEWTLEI